MSYGNYGSSSMSFGYGSGSNACAIPQHNETMKIPHYKYTVHTKPTVTKWVTKELMFREIPVTQEAAEAMHPTQEICVQAPAACAPAKSKCASPCGGSAAYGVAPYGAAIVGGGYGLGFGGLYGGAY